MISVIIPALNEESTIGRLISWIAADEQSGSLIREIIIADGGSEDQTRKVALDAGAKVISTQPGRALQMNEGAKVSAGKILYFLHSDTFPPAGFARKICTAVNKKADAGCFRLQFDNPHPLLTFFGWCTRFDFPWFRFGDQSLFILKTSFEEAGGFDESLTVMEDNEFIRRVRKHYSFTVLPDPVITSSRKYEQVGIVKLQLIFLSIVVLYEAGVSQTVLRHWYRNALALAE